MYRTKGTLVKELKELGIRKGDKDGAVVSLEHLKYYQLVNLYYKHCIWLEIIMDLEYLRKQKEKYLDRMKYFDAIDFSNLSRTFQDVVDMISQMEIYIQENNIKEKENQNENQNENNI